jgi:hypothetical protein
VRRADESSRCETRRTLQQILPLEDRSTREYWLEELPDDAERELSLQLRTPSPQHAHATSVCDRSRPREYRCLAHPGRAFDDNEAASTVASPVERGCETLEFAITFEER